MIKKVLLGIFYSSLSLSSLFAQSPDDGTAPIMDLNIKDKSLRVINQQTSTVLPKGSWEISIQHRFGAINSGSDNLYGIDNMNSVRIGADIGVYNKLNVGIGRSSYQKTYNGYLKYQLLGGYGKDFDLTYVADMIIDTRNQSIWGVSPFYNTHRFNFTHQLIFSYAIGERVLISLLPTLVHFNMVENTNINNDVFVAAANARLGITKQLFVSLEGSNVVPVENSPVKKNPTIGVGLEYFTPKHTFQISFSNSRSMNEPYFFVTDNNVPTALNQFCLGFNIVRRW